MSLQYVDTKDKLPMNSDYECPVCQEPIDIDEIIDGVPNCGICNNGHRIHNECLKKLNNRVCPICRSTNFTNCKSRLGYSYVARKGGKIMKGGSKKRRGSKIMRRGSKKNKTHKKRKGSKKNKRLKFKKV